MLRTEVPAPTSQRPRVFADVALQGRILLSQMPLALSVLVVFAACVYLAPGESLSDAPFLVGVGGVAILTILSGAVPWHRLPEGAYWSIPLLDFAAIALIWGYARFMLDGMVMLTAFPVVWLTWSGLYPKLAILLGVLGSAAVTWWPYLVQIDQLDSDDLLRPALVPFFMLALAVASSVLTQSMDRQHKAAEATLVLSRQQTRRLEAVLETTDVGIVVTDRDGHDRIMKASQRRTHLLGLPPGLDDASEDQLLVYEADGTTPIPPDDRPVRRAVLGESFQDRLITLGNPPGQQSLSVSAQSMVDDDGEFDGTVVVFQNVTELLNAFQARERFIADISHEFRTPLTSIIGYLELAQEEDLEPVLASYLATINRNAERLLALVTSLLDSAADFTDLALRDSDLTKLLRHSVESATVPARKHAIQLVADLPPSLPLVCDRMRVSQVIDNLLSNALKYTETGGVVTVSAHGDDDHVEFAVADSGVGMSEDEVQRVFGSFYRTERVRKAAIPGTGLGLSITQRLVDAHDGSIEVESTPGVGTTFTVRLPRRP